MSKATTKTLNSFPLDKINLRIEALNKINKDVVKVLDCFHGYGKIWHEIQKRTDKKIELFGIEIDKEKKSNFNVVYGDNKKIIPSIDISKYDIIDIDAFGDSYNLIKTIYDKLKENTIVVYTHISVNMGGMNKELIKDTLGYDIYKKCRTMFNSRFVDIFEAGLYKLGIREIVQMNKNNKIYGFFIKKN